MGPCQDITAKRSSGRVQAAREMDEDLRERKRKAAMLRPLMGPEIKQSQPELHSRMLQLKRHLGRAQTLEGAKQLRDRNR